MWLKLFQGLLYFIYAWLKHFCFWCLGSSCKSNNLSSIKPLRWKFVCQCPSSCRLAVNHYCVDRFLRDRIILFIFAGQKVCPISRKCICTLWQRHFHRRGQG